jgi:hypothetical protein
LPNTEEPHHPAFPFIDVQENPNTRVTRVLVLAVALAFILFFGILTVSVIAKQGLTVGGLIAILILAMFCFGILGALRNPPK